MLESSLEAFQLEVPLLKPLSGETAAVCAEWRCDKSGISGA